ncbi:MAG: DUF1295 domain-containing protein [Eubacteriales bacterium]|nr:DUF1295 domain-containing protein [Eubacteriales bacterium]
MTEKNKGLLVNLFLYAGAFGVGLIPFVWINDLFAAEAALTAAATLVIYIVTCFVPDTSLYDPYWSVTPPVMLLAAMVKYRFWSANAVLLLLGVLVWSLRLTINWAVTYRGLCHEDWRYRMFREKYGKLGFALINFTGLQFVPTLVVYAGLVAAFFVVESDGFQPLMLIGLAVMLAGAALEWTADRAIHRFLRENKGALRTCDVSLWRYSRHPNYFGEMTFWFGIFIAFLTVRSDIWYYGLGFLLIVALFCAVSIPMMERHNAERRADYAAYKRRTSVLLPLPPRKPD